MDSIKIKRGLSRDLPQNMPLGELAFCVDTKELFIGNDDLPPIQVAGGGGGGGTGGTGNSEVTLTSTSPEVIKIAFGNTLNVPLTFTSTTNRSGTLTIKVNGETKKTLKINIGTNDVDISSFLRKGANTVEFTATDIYGALDFLIFTVDAIELSLSTTFNNKIAYASDINFTYVPIGNLSKQVHFLIDGVETYVSTITTSNVSQTQKILKLPHGIHVLEVYSTAMIGDNEVRSNTLKLEIISTESGNNTPIIWSSFVPIDVEQYTSIVVPYIVYNPVTTTAPVELYVNGEKVASTTVDRKEKTWVINDYHSGVLTLKIKSDTTERTFTVNVSPVEIDIEPEILDLDLHLSTNNRTNQDINRDIWENNGISAIFTNFNWQTDGWLPDADNLSSLVLKQGATLEIPIKPFTGDIRTTGKTIEFELSVEDVTNYNADIISCISGGRGFKITPKKAEFQSNEIDLDTFFKEDERIRISFVIEPSSATRLIYTYVNGIISRIDRYSLSDIFDQQTPVNIILGSTEATLRLYNIRVYSRAVSTKKMLDNYIYDMSNIKRKIQLFDRNNVYDSYGELKYTSLLDQIPVMTWVGELPPVKDDVKYLSSVSLENKFETARNFVRENVEADVQGTSSQFFPKKNYKFKFAKVGNYKYKIRENSIAESKFTLKADYMESSHSHNVGLARWINDVAFKDLKAPPQLKDPLVRIAIDGYPVAVFHKETPESTPKYFGIYNFNVDKKADDTFGATQGFLEGWEVANNTSPRCLFQESEYEAIDTFTGLPEYLLDFEMRFGKDDKDYTNLKRLTDWILSCKDNPVKFKQEASQYFNVDYLIYYYLITEFFVMVDSRAKNLFLNTYDGNIWYPVFFDADTMMGLNNEGVLDFDYFIEGNDKIGSLNAYNGKNSELWKNVETAFALEIRTAYNQLRDSDKLNYEVLSKYFFEDQIERICEAQYNEDALYKYLEPVLQENNSTFLYVAQGSRINFMKYWLYNRFKYADSKYYGSEYRDDFISMRLYTPETWGGVAPSGNITVTSFIDQYISIDYADAYVFHERGKANTPYTVQPTGLIFNDTDTKIFGASKLLSIGDLAKNYVGTIDITKAVKLTELKLGSSAVGYSNTNLRGLSANNNPLLKKLDVTNCPNLTNVLDLSNCRGIEEVYAKGTKISSVSLSTDGSNLKKLHLPSTTTSLIIKNQPKLTDLVLEGYTNVNTIELDNVGFNPLALLTLTPNLQKVRLMNLNVRSTTLAIDNLLKAQGMNENGELTSIGNAVSGKISLVECSTQLETYYKSQLPNVQFTVETYLPSYTVTFVDGDGKVLETKQVIKNGEAVYTGGVTPTKTSTAQYHYTYNGWTGYGFNPIKPIIGDATIVAQFTSVTRQYTITFTDRTGTVLKSDVLNYGATPVPPSFPSGDNEWNPVVTSVTGTKTYASYYAPTATAGVFTYTSTTINGVSGYYATLNTTTLPSQLVFPTKYSSKPVFYVNGNTSNTTRANVTAVYIPLSYTQLGTSLLEGMSNITGVIDLSANTSLTAVQSNAFKGCSNITNIKLPSSVTSYGSEVFSGCIGIIGEFVLPTTMTTIPIGLFDGCTNLTTISGANIEIVGQRAFKDCSKLTTLNLPKLKTITSGVNYTDGAFYKCTALTSVNLPLLETLGGYAFHGCTGLTSVTLPSIKSVGGYAFSLTGINNADVESILSKNPTLSSSAFRDCESITAINVPSNVTSLPSYCFYSCGNLKTFTAPSVSVINTGLFNNCDKLTTISFGSPSSPVTTVYGGNSAYDGAVPFYNCSSLVYANLCTVNGLQSDVTFTTSFLGSVTPRSFHYTQSSAVFKSNETYTYAEYSDSVALISSTYLKEHNQAIIIPDTLNGKNITLLARKLFINFSAVPSFTLPTNLQALGDSCFEYCSALTSITIPNSVTSLGDSCFYRCSSLTSATIGNSVMSLGSSCFGYCSALTSITIPNSVTSLGSNCFDSCSKLTSITILNSVTSLGDSCFGYCSALTSITIPNSVTSLGDRCFYRCSNLTSATIGNSVTSLGSSCFGYCSTLTSITIPNSVTSLGDSCFYRCSSLTSATIGNSVMSIGFQCFYECTLLTSITIPDSVTSVGGGCFIGTDRMASLTFGKGVTSYSGSGFLTYFTRNIGLMATKTVITFQGTMMYTSGSDSPLHYYADELVFGSPGNPYDIANTGSLLAQTTAVLSSGVAPSITKVTIYTATGTNAGFTGQPWGATNATFVYVQA